MAATSVCDLAPIGALSDAALVAWQPRYPAVEVVGAAAAALEGASSRQRVDPLVAGCSTGVQVLSSGVAHEGPRWWAQVSGGRIRVGSTDFARAQRTDERSVDTRRRQVEAIRAWCAERERVLAETGEDIGGWQRSGGRRIITEWSAASRARMVERLATLDYDAVWSARPPAMVTLTLPSAWWEYAPSGEAWKRLLRRFFARYQRAWGSRPVGLWKQEMQRRGAPHLHMLIALPVGTTSYRRPGFAPIDVEWRDWMGLAWADCLGVEGEERERVLYVHRRRQAWGDTREGLRASDPRRVAVYFLKHGQFGQKEYQNRAPDLWAGSSVGRWWGYWGLRVVSAVARLEAGEAQMLVRTLRRWNRATNGRAKVRRRRPGSRRWVTYRRDRMTGRAGFLLVNDAPLLAFRLAALLVWGRGAASGASTPPPHQLRPLPADPSAHGAPGHSEPAGDLDLAAAVLGHAAGGVPCLGLRGL